MKKAIIVIVLLAATVLSLPAGAQSDELSEVKISATIRTYVLRAPHPNAELIATFDAGAEDTAYGRDADSNWLRTMDGWVLAEVLNTEGEIGTLPDTTVSFDVTLISATRVYSGPSEKWFESIGVMERESRSLAIGRNEDATWLKLPVGWVTTNRVRVEGDVSLLPVASSGVIITAKTRTFILKEPDLSAEFVDVFEEGDEALAIGQAGAWVQIAQGWVSAEAVKVRGNVKELRYAGKGILITVKRHRDLRNVPIAGDPVQGGLRKGRTVYAHGRNEAGTWLMTENGWIVISTPPNHSMFISAEADIMSLPIVDYRSSTTISAVSSRPVPTPEPNLDTRTIRALISRHTDDIRILDIETASNATTIEYDLKPWPFVPNESIANEVAFKIICAIRNGQQIPNTLKFIGHTHFKSEVGRKYTGPSVEMHISANNANRIVCRGNDPSDINWRRIASRYKSYPIPRGASIDYD